MSARDVIDRVLFEMGYTATESTADAILSALTAAGYAVEQGWRTIDTAPRGGTLLLCYAPAVLPDYSTSVQRLDRWEGKYAGFAHMRPGQPYTHWRPLPAPPAGEGK